MILRSDKKKVLEIRKLMEKHKILAVYAEQVADGKMSIAEAIEKSFNSFLKKKDKD